MLLVPSPRLTSHATPIRRYLANDGIEYMLGEEELPTADEWKELLGDMTSEADHEARLERERNFVPQTEIQKRMAETKARLDKQGVREYGQRYRPPPSDTIIPTKRKVEKIFFTPAQKHAMLGTLQIRVRRPVRAKGQPCGITLQAGHDGDPYPVITKIATFDQTTNPAGLSRKAPSSMAVACCGAAFPSFVETDGLGGSADAVGRRVGVRLQVGDRIKMINFQSCSSPEEASMKLDSCSEAHQCVLRGASTGRGC